MKDVPTKTLRDLIGFDAAKIRSEIKQSIGAKARFNVPRIKDFSEEDLNAAIIAATTGPAVEHVDQLGDFYSQRFAMAPPDCCNTDAGRAAPTAQVKLSMSSDLALKIELDASHHCGIASYWFKFSINDRPETGSWPLLYQSPRVFEMPDASSNPDEAIGIGRSWSWPVREVYRDRVMLISLHGHVISRCATRASIADSLWGPV